MSADQSGFTMGNSDAPQGTQVAFVKNTGIISQQVYLNTGVYDLSFLAAQRANVQATYQEIEVLLDGTVVGTITPSSTTYGLYQTPLFTVSSGPHTIEFLGLNPNGGDNTVFVDEVQV